MYKISKKKFRGPFNLNKTIESDQCPSDLWKRPMPFHSFLKTFDGDFVEYTAWEDENYFYYDAEKRLTKEFKYMFWSDYPIDEFYKKFRKDKYVNTLIRFGNGIRLMRDLDINYRIIEAIITQNSNLKRIRKLDELLRNKFGNGYTYDISKLAKAKVSQLQELGLGYRAEYVIEVAKAIVSGKININELKQLSTSDARNKLMEIKGIGPKVADLILGFGFGKRDVFPADVWLKRAIAREYGIKPEKAQEFAINYFGEHANIVHVYIYYYERKRRKIR